MEREDSIALMAGKHSPGPSRRAFIQLFGAGVLGGAICTETLWGREKEGAKPLRGIFPIAQTPFTESNKLDLDALGAEVKFLDKAGVHGVVWPQLASEYWTLSESERLAGAEAILAAGKGLRPAFVIGVQDKDVTTAIRYAKHAEKTGADAIISLPPADQQDFNAIIDYYRRVGMATALPLIAQTTGDASVEQVIQLSKAVPTLRCVKDEAGASPLSRIGPLREKSGDELKVFTGNHGRTLIDEMERGTAGCMPASGFVDLYTTVWDQWHAGNHKEAMDVFGKALMFVTEAETYGVDAVKYIMHVRGILPNFAVRAGGAKAPLDDSAKKTLREMLDAVKPFLKA